MKGLLFLLVLGSLNTAHGAFLEDDKVTLEYTRGPYAWVIKKDHWDASDEVGYGQFVSRLGEGVASGRCSNVTDCMNSPVNPYHKSDPDDLQIMADCADWTYLLRAYYAWKNHLPFAFTTMKSHPLNPPQIEDLRYTPFGNVVVDRFSLVSNENGFPSAKQFFTEIIPGIISTANIRTNQPVVENNLWSDFYPIKISTQSLRPGTTVYDPFGHVVVVYKITNDGQIYYVDAHTDNNLTVGVFNEKFVRTHALIGGGFKNWRPVRLIDYKKGKDGVLLGGRIVAAPNSGLSHFSEVQYYGNLDRANKTYENAQFSVEGRSASFFEYVQAEMSKGPFKINPLSELKDRLGEICQTMQARSRSVESARKNGIYLQDHPETLPYNIYVAMGDWETYSSPSRDAVLRILYSTILSRSKEWIRLWKTKSSHLVYQGNNLPADLIRTYQEISEKCVIQYRNSSGQPLSFHLEEARSRLPNMSFDAYHCPELRWGAPLDSTEGRSCHTNEEKNYWYRQEQYLRNQTERRFDVRMDYTASELSPPRPGVGSPTVPDTDVLKYLNQQL